MWEREKGKRKHAVPSNSKILLFSSHTHNARIIIITDSDTWRFCLYAVRPPLLVPISSLIVGSTNIDGYSKNTASYIILFLQPSDPSFFLVHIKHTGVCGTYNDAPWPIYTLLFASKRIIISLIWNTYHVTRMRLFLRCRQFRGSRGPCYYSTPLLHPGLS